MKVPLPPLEMYPRYNSYRGGLTVDFAALTALPSSLDFEIELFVLFGGVEDDAGV